MVNDWTDFDWYALGMLGGAVAGFAYEYVFQTPEVATGDSLRREAQEVAAGDSPGREAPAEA